MSVTLSALRRNLGLLIGDYEIGEVTSDGNAGGTTFLDAAFGARILTDNVRKGQWVLITSGTYSGAEGFITSTTQSNGTITVSATLGGKILDGVTYEIHQVRPSLKLQYLNRALERAYPYIHKRYDDRSLITRNVLLNANFEDWTLSTVPDSWVSSGGATVAANTSVVRDGSKSASFTTVAYATDYLYQSLTQNPALADLAGTTVTAYAWARQLTSALAAYIEAVVTDSAGTAVTYTGSAGSAAGNIWEKISCSGIVVPVGVSAIQKRLRPGKNGTTFFDYAHLAGTPYEQRMPTGMDYLLAAYQGNDWDDWVYGETETPLLGCEMVIRDGVRYIHFDELPTEGKKLRLVGYGRFTALSADTDTVEMTERQARVIAEGAASDLLRSGVTVLKDWDGARMRTESDRLDRSFERGLRDCQMATYPFQVNLRRNMDEG